MLIILCYNKEGENMKDALHELANKIQRFKNDILNEEATKNSCILPFLSILGYDIHNLKKLFQNT